MMETRTVSKRLVHHNQNQVMDIATACVMLKKSTMNTNLRIQSYRSTEEESCAIRHTE